MRGGKSGSLKGKNKWVRPDDGHNSAPVQPVPPPKPNSAPDVHEQPALKKVGKFALARDPAPQKPSRPPQTDPKPTVKPVPASSNRARFKYERPKDSAAAAAAAAVSAPPPSLPSTATTAGGAQKVKPIVRPGKLRWNKYVRQSIGGENEIQQPLREATAAAAAAPPKGPTPAPASALPLSASELQLRRRSKRISAASELVRKHQGRNVPQRTQRAMQLLRLGGQFYSLVGRKGKGRSLKLQSNPIASTISTHPPSNQNTLKPKPRPAAPAAAPTLVAPQAIASGSRKSLLPPTRSASKVAAQAPKQNKPMSRLKGGRLVYCPVYCHTGRCPRRGRGCPLRHDPTKRAVCPLWLRNKCFLGASCPLQHQRRPELMPACVHYLQGRCNNPDCPYLHVDLAKDAPHCAAFLRGYCAAGVNCASKHYTLKQIKEERKLVAGGKRRGETRKKETKQHDGGAGGNDEKLKKRKKRRGRYFDLVPSDDEVKGQELENKEKEEGQSGKSNESDSEDDDAHIVSSSDTSKGEGSDTDSDSEAEKSEDEDDDEEEDQPPQKRSRRLTGAPLPDFIGL